MFNVFYSKETGKIVHISQANAGSDELLERWRKKYELHLAVKDKSIAYRLLTGEFNWKEYIVHNNWLTKVKIRKIDRPHKLMARQPLQKIEKEFQFDGVEVHMTLIYHRNDKSLTIHFGDNIEFDPPHQIHFFITLEDEPTILLKEISCFITKELHLFLDVPDLSQCGIYTIRHFTNINYKEVE